MTISNGDKMPAGSFKVMTSDGVQDMSTDDLFSGKKVALFSVPGAFTPKLARALDRNRTSILFVDNQALHTTSLHFDMHK